MSARVGVLTVGLSLPGCRSLKEKRSRLRPLLDGVRARFRVSVAETGRQNRRDGAIVSCAVVGSSRKVIDGLLQALSRAMEQYDVVIETIETEVW
ncbi:MAG: DUF503 domain-containing protein [Candidatus Hydrogenedentota bacterium]|nr:MAG: DUF503 domain-containing protein [Candidatus Hydrogenedentota bacterium]